MEDLLMALRKRDPTLVTKFARELLVTWDNKLNKLQANEFEHFAKCKIEEWPDNTVFKQKCYVGTIVFNGDTYGF